MDSEKISFFALRVRLPVIYSTQHYILPSSESQRDGITTVETSSFIFSHKCKFLTACLLHKFTQLAQIGFNSVGIRLVLGNNISILQNISER